MWKVWFKDREPLYQKDHKSPESCFKKKKKKQCQVKKPEVYITDLPSSTTQSYIQHLPRMRLFPNIHKFPRTERPSLPVYLSYEVIAQVDTVVAESLWEIITETRNSLNINSHVFCNMNNGCLTDLSHNKRYLSPVNKCNSHNGVQSKHKERY